MLCGIDASFRRGDALENLMSLFIAVVYRSKVVPTVLIPQEAHNKHIFSNLEWLGTRYIGSFQTFEIPHLFLCPEADHLTWVAFRISTPEAVFTSNITITVFED